MRADVGRDLYDFIAMHYVRSKACRRQIEYMVDECRPHARLTTPQAELEYKRLLSYQDVEVFDDLVDSVSRVLTHYVICPVEITSPLSFVTSDKIVCASTIEFEQQITVAWFPISPSIGLYLDSEGYGGQILGPTVVNRRLGRIGLAKVPAAQWLRCQTPSPLGGGAEVVNALNGMMVEGSPDLYAADLAAMDSALRTAERPTGYRYRPPDNSRPD